MLVACSLSDVDGIYTKRKCVNIKVKKRELELTMAKA